MIQFLNGRQIDLQEKFFTEFRAVYTTLSQQHKIVINNADFPPTFWASAMGIRLSDAYLEERCAKLNLWLLSLLKLYHRFPSDGQRVIQEFFQGDRSEEDEESRILDM
jgi:hypothetical protein